MSEIIKKWYVVRIIGNKEKIAKEYITKEMGKGLLKHVSDVLVPTEKYYVIKNGKRVSAERNFFPGYLFVEVTFPAFKSDDDQDDSSERKRFEREILGMVQNGLRELPNVVGFLTEGKERAINPVRQSEIDRILGRVDELIDQDGETLVPFVVGEAVKIIDGPFKDFSGNVEEILEERRKLKVMVRIFGRKSVIELNFAQVTKE
ncbi:MAG: transcription termination/antitermination factor NusG [Bacteroidales bacterium]|nr:transcription termination/antitermination factor NusG [Bacteroidales bacterium]